MDAAFRAVAEPHRRRILQLLGRSKELSSGEIATHFRLTAPAVSQHLGVLERARLVAIRREGTRRLYRLREEGFRELSAFVEGFWAHQLERLKSAVEKESVPQDATRRPRQHGKRNRRRSR